MRPPSSQQASRSGAGLADGLEVTVGVQLAVGLRLGEGEGDGETVKATVGMLIFVAVSEAANV
jgi:hypothetical protein